MAYSAATGETARIRNLTEAIRPVCALNRLLLAILPRWALADAADRKRLRVTVAKFFREHAKEAEQCLTRLFIALSTFTYEEFPHDLKELFNLCYTSIQIMERLHRQHFPENKLIHRFYHNELDIFRALMPNKSEQGKAMWKAMIAKLDLTLSDIRTLCTLTADSLDPRGTGHVRPHDDILKQLRNISDGLRKSHENEREILTWVSEEPEKHQPKDGRRNRHQTAQYHHRQIQRRTSRSHYHRNRFGRRPRNSGRCVRTLSYQRGFYQAHTTRKRSHQPGIQAFEQKTRPKARLFV